MTSLINQQYQTLLSFCNTMTPDEEKITATKAKSGCQIARSKLIKMNLRLATSVAMKYMGRGTDLDDIIQEANIGLIRAADKFDPDRGVKFSTYATFWIEESIQRYFVNTSETIRIPVTLSQELNKIRRALYSILSDDNKSIVTTKKLSEITGFSEKKIKKNYDLIQAFQFTDSDEYEFSKKELDIHEYLQHENIIEKIDEWLDRLTQEQRFIVVNRFGLNDDEMSITDIAKSINKPIEFVRKEIVKIIKVLRDSVIKDGFQFDDFISDEKNVSGILNAKRKPSDD